MLRVAGTAGAVWVGYQVAAHLGAWSLELLPVVPKAYRVEAHLLAMSDYWLAQTPLDLVLEVGGESWRWCDVAPTVAADAGRITFTLRQTPAVRPSAVAVTR